MSNSDILHVVPTHDRTVIQVRDRTVRVAFEHDTSTGEPDCLCGPIVEPVKRDDGSMGWLIVHHSLDGRERTEGESA